MERNSGKNMFLRPQDLRIGNYINYENTTHIVTELHQEKLIHNWINYAGDAYVTKYTQILSIPLSVKEIENLGFQEDFDRIKHVDGYFDNQGHFIEVDGDAFWLCRHNDENDYVRIAPMDFVHELQNLYFDLTKNELEFGN
jgi:hypothetical protein